MLLRNGRDIYQNPGRSNGRAGELGNQVKGGFRNRFVGGLTAIFGGYANGHLSPSSFVLPTASGSLSSYTESSSAIVGTAFLTPAVPMVVTGTLVMTQGTVTLDKIAAMIASGAGVLAVNTAFLASAVQITANGTLIISGTATLGGIFEVSASSAMVLTPNVTSSALANMIAEAGGPTPLSPEGLASAVWSTSIDGTYTSEDILKILAAVAAGKTQIVDLGGGAASVTFRDLPDSLDRVAADMLDSERTNVTIDNG